MDQNIRTNKWILTMVYNDQINSSYHFKIIFRNRNKYTYNNPLFYRIQIKKKIIDI